MNSIKVFYAVVDGDDAAVWCASPSPSPCAADLRSPRPVHSATFVTAKHERIPYPLAVIQRLAGLLQASTLVYPFAKRKFGELDIGFLERL